MFRITMLPAADGDCFLVETASAAGTHRLLIDGGRTATARHYLRPLIAGLAPRPGPTIDLMVLTHVDADHIEGLLDLVGADDAPTIRELWFNEMRHLKLAKDLRPAPRAGKPIPTLNVPQGISFAKLVHDRGYGWNTTLRNGPVMIDGGTGKLPSFCLSSGAVLTLLGPPREKLAAFAQDWSKAILNFNQTPEVVLTKRVIPVPTVQNVEALARDRDVADTKKPNGTSISFVLEHEHRRVMFSADGHPDDLASALRRFQPQDQRIRFDAIKVPHHGSAANNTSQLIDLLDSPLWLISSNGAVHRHPDPEAIARIVLAESRGKKLVFNYATQYNKVWARDELHARFGYKVEFAPSGEAKVIDLV
ncbi:MBL fold metallo-hydrolase [Bradyrhizobium sp. HKCCYLRH1062]|uniref:MBL fold metallo-hydrolase n=1 Tax=unclassified Bradyrhizobium TaxID=2631580 RepID=UPI003EB79448